jgi:hypothetical protein
VLPLMVYLKLFIRQLDFRMITFYLESDAENKA